jgi:hypothetical protein
MTAARDLAMGTLERLTTGLGLERAEELPLRAASNGAEVGAMRVFEGKAVDSVVYAGLTVPQLGLDSHMLFAFTRPDSVVPHFTLDAVCTGALFAFHLDLIPRVDLGADLPYVDSVMHPLTEHWLSAQRLPGLSPAHLTPRQNAFMSPWMIAYRATAEAFAHLGPWVTAYRDHWLHLVEHGVDSTAPPDALRERDRKHRAALFNPKVDPIWARIDQLVGAETSARMRRALAEPRTRS